MNASGFHWSFSRLTTFEQCPLAFRLQYLDCFPQEDNAYAEYGTFCHELLEAWAKGRLLSFELAQAFEDGFDHAILHDFPPYPQGLGQRYYDAGIKYFTDFDGFGSQQRIIAAEERFDIEIGGNPFTGIVDLILEDRDTGVLTLIDHKSKSTATMKKQIKTYEKQLDIYALATKHLMGRYPDTLCFNLFRDGYMMVQPFSLARLQQTEAWICQTIEAIKATTDWTHLEKPTYFCHIICSVARECPMMRGL